MIVERWNGIPFEEPYKQVRDMVRFLRDALTGEKVRQALRHASRSRASGSASRPEQQPPILVAALREGMLRLAGREADGAIINWLSADDVTHGGRRGRTQRRRRTRRSSARIFVCPSEDADAVRAAGRFAIAAYLNVPVYAAFHDWLGRGELLRPMWDAWKAGDRKAALAAIPDALVDELIVHGSPEECRAHIQRYFDNGVTTTSLAIMPLDPELDHWEAAMRALSPHAG